MTDIDRLTSIDIDDRSQREGRNGANPSYPVDEEEAIITVICDWFTETNLISVESRLKFEEEWT